MQPIRIGPAGLMASKILILFAGMNCLSAFSLQAAAPPATVRLQNAGVDAEGLQTFRLEWNSVSNATYRVQRSDSLGSNALWKAVDVVTPVGGASQLEIKGRSIPENSVEFFRLLLPQPEIFSVEPAVIAPGVPVDIFLVGQCFGSNDVLRINGVPQTNVFQSSSLLSRPSFTPDVAGTYVFELVVAGLVVSSFNVICADAAANLELVFQGPPELPPASPQGVYSSRKGYEYYQAQSQLNSAGLHNNPAFQPNNNAGEMPRGHRAAFLSKKGYDYYQFNTAVRFSGGGDDDCDGEADDSFDALTVEQCNFFAQDGKVTICHGTAAVAGGIAGGAVAGIVIAAREASVTPFSGEVQQQVVDLAVEGRGLDFIWARTYHSRLGRFDTAANGWTFSYDVRCAQNSSGDVDVYDGTGRKDTFKLQTNGVYTCPEFFREGTLTKGVFRLTFADTGYWEFNPLDAATPDSKLSRIVDRNGNTMSLDYDGSGRLMQIVDDLGRTNSVRYDAAGRIAAVTDFSGRTVTYSYYAGEPGGSRGDLKSVTSPPVTGTPNKNDFPEGKTTTYTYSTGYRDERENHLLLSEMDAQGQTVSQHVYQHNQTDLDFLRCVSVQRWTNTPTRLSYLPQTPTPANQFAVLRCVMNDPVGNVTEYFYDARNRCVKLQEFTGRSTPGVSVTATGNRPSGKVRPSDPDFYECRAEWNNDSLCRKLVMFGGQQVQSVYESDLDKSTLARKRADLRVLRQVACCGGGDLDGDGTMDLTERVWRFEYDPRFGSTQIRNKPSGCSAREKREAHFGETSTEHAINTKGTGAVGKTGSCGGHSGHAGDYIASDAGFITSSTDPRGNISSASYDANGNCLVVNPNAARDNHLQGAVDVVQALRFAYNSSGQLTAITNAADINGFRRVDRLTYFLNGPQAGYLQSIAIDEPGVQLTTSFERDLRGNVTRVIDPRGNDHLFTYNALDQCVRVQPPVNLTARCATDYFYDANDNLVSRVTEVRSETDGLVGSNVHIRGYDPLHRLTRSVRSVSATYSLTNDFVYDGNDQCVLALGGDAVSGADPFQTVSLQYDERGLLYRESSAPGSTVQSTTQYDYNADGNLTRASEGLEETPQVTTMEYDGFAGFGSSSLHSKGVAIRVQIQPRSLDTETNFQIPGGVIAGFGEVEYSLMRFELRGCGTTPLAGSLRLIAPIGFSTAQAWVETVWNKQCVEKDTSVSKITDAMGNVTTFNYDANNNLKLVRHFGQTNDVPGTNGNVRLAESRYEYDGLDRLVRSRYSFFNVATQAPIGDGESTTTFSYAPNGACLSVADDLGRSTSFAYDTACRLSSVTDALGNTRLITRDACGNPTAITAIDRSDLSAETQTFSMNYTYDSLNRCVVSVDNVGNTERCTYDSRGNLVSCVTPRGDETFRMYDGLNRCVTTVNYVGRDRGITINTSHVEYTNDSRYIASTDSNGNVTRYNYDSRHRLVLLSNPDGTSRSFVWSPRSNLIREQDANGTVITNTYDLLNRCVRRDIIPGPGVAATTTGGIYCGNHCEGFAYDSLSRLVTANYNVSQLDFSYDSMGNCVGSTQDGLTSTRTFDALGNRLALTYPGGTVVTHAYNALNEVTNVSRILGGYPSVTLATFAYEGPGRVGRITRNNGVSTRVTWNGTVNPANAAGDFGWQQVRSINHQVAGGGAVIDRRGYSYDRNQNKTLRAQLTPFTTGGDRTTNIFDYDSLDRLRLAIKTKGTSAQRNDYTLDGNGNRQQVISNGVAQSYVMEATIPPGDFQMDQYTLTPFGAQEYDANGNRIALNSSAGQVQYFYDFADRLVSVGQLNASGVMEPLVSYTYDALGRRISKTTYPPAPSAPVTTQFIHGGDEDCDGILEERVNGVITRSYVLPQVGDEVLVAFTQSGEPQYYHCDDLGNALALTDAGGNVLERYDYDDFGSPHFLNAEGNPLTGSDGQPVSSSPLGNPFLFHGMEWDSETEHYFEAWPCRWKAPELNAGSDALQHSPSYFDPQTGSWLTSIGLPKITPKISKESHGKFGLSVGNNPWSAGPGP